MAQTTRRDCFRPDREALRIFVITAKGEGTASRLSYRAEHLLWGIAAGVGVPIFDSGDLIMGNLGEVAVFRSGVQIAPGLQRMFPTYGVPAPQATVEDLRAAARIAASIRTNGRRKGERPLKLDQPLLALSTFGYGAA